MDKQQFLTTMKLVFKSEGIASYDEALFTRFLNNDKKNSVVTIAKKDNGENVFFKAIKPWAQARGFQDFDKGLLLSRLLVNAGFTASAQLLKSGEIEAVPYALSSVLPIQDTVSDPRLEKLPASAAARILTTYRDEQKKVNSYLKNHLREASMLIPYSNFSQQFSFWGQMVMFEENLYRKGHIQSKKITDVVVDHINTPREKSDDSLFLLHGDFSPHNIIYGDSLYFIDWERCIVVADPLIGENYDIANLYVYAFKNKSFQQVLYHDSLSFKICMTYHLLYKANYIMTYNVEKDKELLDWCANRLDNLEL